MHATTQTKRPGFPAPGGATPAGSPAANETAADLQRLFARVFLQNVPDAVYFKDRESRFLAVSHSLARMFGLDDPAAMIGRSDFDYFAEAHARQAYDDEQRIMRTAEPIIGLLERETWPDGRVTWALSSKLPLRNDAGEVVGTFGISKDVTHQKEVESELETAHKQLVDASRLAGMAEVATGVLHNVGNVLNSVNVSTSQIADTLRQSKTANLGKVCALLQEHASDLATFLTQDPKGQRLPSYLESLAKHLAEERDSLLREVESLRQNVEHIKDIVAMQQSYAMVAGVREAQHADDLVEDALRMNTAALLRHDVEVERIFARTPPVLCEKPKVLQILVNLIRNAKYALDEQGHTDKRLTLRIEDHARAGVVRIIVSDNGVGIPPENLERIFCHGFTTRKDGHGFGLHSSANAAKEMGGSLTAHSEGRGLGATFILELPLAREEAGQSAS